MIQLRMSQGEPCPPCLTGTQTREKERERERESERESREGKVP